MSNIKFELTKEHINILGNLKWGMLGDNHIVSAENLDEDTSSFGSFNDNYEAIDLILNGKPQLLNLDEVKYFSEDEKNNMDKIFKELPTALEIILQTKTFTPGLYKCRYHEKIWKKIK